jgi:hypothetical protein
VLFREVMSERTPMTVSINFFAVFKAVFVLDLLLGDCKGMEGKREKILWNTHLYFEGLLHEVMIERNVIKAPNSTQSCPL